MYGYTKNLQIMTIAYAQIDSTFHASGRVQGDPFWLQLRGTSVIVISKERTLLFSQSWATF